LLRSHNPYTQQIPRCVIPHPLLSQTPSSKIRCEAEQSTDRITIGVEKFEVSLEEQTADVWAKADVNKLAISNKIIKSGKTVHSGTADGEPIDLAAAKATEA
jgi:hypothetical protein